MIWGHTWKISSGQNLQLKAVHFLIYHYINWCANENDATVLWSTFKICSHLS
jgi:hypothetical protein